MQIQTDKSVPVAFLAELPEDVLKRMAFHEGVLHFSKDIDRHYLVSLLGKLRQRGVVLHRSEEHSLKDFQDKYAKFAPKKITDDNTIQALAKKLIELAYEKKATDIHIIDNGAYTRIKFRILGLICEHDQLHVETGQRLIRVIYDHLGSGKSADGHGFTKSESQDGLIDKPDVLPDGVYAVRIHTSPIQGVKAGSPGTHMALRLLFDSTGAAGSSLDERMGKLGFLPEHIKGIERLIQRKGLVVVAGSIGQGKTTFLNNLMAYMTEFFPERSYHSVEDPPEYTLKDVQQIRVSTKQGKTAVSQTMRRDAYVNALADSMRSDLNVLMIGETRYAEAAECAIDAAVTGHLVLTTTHATNAFAIITRFENFLRAAKFSDPLGALCDPNVLAGLVCQCLIAKLCPVCRKPLKTLSPEEHAKALPAFMVPAFIGVFGTDRPEGVYVRGDGCPKCYLGLHGQTVVAEVVVMDQRMLAMLRCGKMMDAYNYWKAQTGSISYVEHAVKLIREGILDPYIATIRMGVPLDFNPFFEGDAL